MLAPLYSKDEKDGQVHFYSITANETISARYKFGHIYWLFAKTSKKFKQSKLKAL